MTDYKVLATAQYWENTCIESNNWDGVSESWRAKGGEQFTVDMDGDARMVLGDSKIKEFLETLMVQRSNKAIKYALVDFEFIDGNITDLTKDFDKLMEDFFK